MLSKIDIFNIVKEQLKNVDADRQSIDVEEVSDQIVERLVEEGLYDEDMSSNFETNESELPYDESQYIGPWEDD